MIFDSYEQYTDWAINELFQRRYSREAYAVAFIEDELYTTLSKGDLLGMRHAPYHYVRVKKLDDLDKIRRKYE